jgi:kynurenine formamidase
MPGLPPLATAWVKRHGDVMLGDGVSTAAEVLLLGGHSGTHMDGWAHVSREGRVFGGGVDEMPPILASAHLVDVEELLGREVTAADEIGGAELDGWFSTHRPPAPSSAVLFRTGWRRHLDDRRRYLGLDGGLPGVGLDGARWLARHSVTATGSDTPAWERQPSPGLPAHVHLLVERGVPILEMLDLEVLARDQVWEFFLAAIPLPIPGGTGSPLRPLAITAPRATGM